MEKAKQFFSDNLVKVYVPIYQKHLTLDDLKKIVAFYESPVGKKLGAVTPAITMEGMTAGQQLGHGTCDTDSTGIGCAR